MAFVERPPEPYLPEEEQPLKAWQVGLVEFDQDEAREAYVGEKYDKFAELFDRFEDSEDFRFSFIWPPLVFGWLWLLYRKMYREAIMIFVFSTLIKKILPLFFMLNDWLIELLMVLVVNVPIAMSGGWLYYQKTEQQIEKGMHLFGDDPPQLIGWLKWNGGVSNWVIPLSIVYICLKIYLTFLTALGTAVGTGIRGG